MSPRALWKFALAIAAAAPACCAMEIAADAHVPFTPETAILGHFSATKKPVATVKSGAIVRIDGGGGARINGSGGELTAASVNTWLKENGIDTTVEQSPALQETIQVLKETTNRLPPAPGAPPGAAGGH